MHQLSENSSRLEANAWWKKRFKPGLPDDSAPGPPEDFASFAVDEFDMAASIQDHYDGINDLEVLAGLQMILVAMVRNAFGHGRMTLPRLFLLYSKIAISPKRIIMARLLSGLKCR